MVEHIGATEEAQEVRPCSGDDHIYRFPEEEEDDYHEGGNRKHGQDFEGEANEGQSGGKRPVVAGRVVAIKRIENLLCDSVEQQKNQWIELHYFSNKNGHWTSNRFLMAGFF